MNKLFCALAAVFLSTASLFAQTDGALLPEVSPVFLNANGSAPAANGFVCTFAAGTTTLLATYADSALMTANQNPIRLNAGGRPNNSGTLISIYMQAASYKINVYATGTGNTCNGVSVGTLIRSIDNVYDIGQLIKAGVIAITSYKINNVRYCNAFAGATAGAKIIACLADLPSTGGIADAIGIEGAQTISSAITISNPGTYLLLGAATYTLTSTITISGHRSGIIGLGQQATVIKFNPAGTSTAITVSGGASAIAQGRLSGFALDASGNTAQVKTGIDLRDTEEWEVSDVAVSNWTTTGTKTSVGIQLEGRQTSKLDRLTISADTPIRISKNFNSGNPDFDHAHFQNIYTLADSNPNIKIDDGVNISNWTVDGYAALVGGTDGINYTSTTDTLAALVINISGVRWEQGTGSTGYCMKFSNSTGFYNINVVGNYCSQARGFYFKDVLAGTLIGNTYISGGLALTTAGNVRMTIASNSFTVGGGTFSLGTALANSVWIANDGNSRIAAGVGAPTNQLVIPNDTSIAGLNQAGNAEVKIAKLSTANQINIAPDATATYIGGSLGVGAIGFAQSHQVAIPNGSSYGGRNNAGSDSIGIAGITSGDKVSIDPQGKGSEFSGNLQVLNGKHVNQSGGNSDFAGATALSIGAATINFSTAFSSAPICVCTDQTAANAVRCSTSTTQLTIAGTGSDAIAYMCIGNPN